MQSTSPNTSTNRLFSWKVASIVVAAIAVLVIGARVTGRSVELRAARSQKWRIGFHQTEPFISPGPDGKPLGFGKDVLSEAARRAQIDLEWIYIPQGASAAFAQNTIDLFPRSSAVPGFARAPYISASWFESFYGLVQKAPKGASPPADLTGKRVASGPTYFARMFAARTLPGALILPQKGPKEVLISVCTGEADAAFAELREATSFLIERPAECRDQPIRLWPIPHAVVEAGIGSTERARFVADLLRDEIRNIDSEGLLATMHARWYQASPSEVTSLNQLFGLQNRQRMLLFFAGFLLLLLLAAAIVSLRMRQLRIEALRASEVKSMFLASMSHEIRTPMNGVIGMANLLRETALTGEQLEMLDTITQSSESLLSIINDVLDVSKLEAGQTRIVSADFSPRQIVQSVASLVKPGARNKDLALSVQVGIAVPSVCKGDALRIRQVLLNLVGNAIKFTDSGRVSISLDCVVSGTESKLRFVVADTGIGIPKADQARLFTAFTQVESGMARTYEGSGLGLAISKKLVLLMGGEIGLDSSPGEGSNFWFELPCVAAESQISAMVVQPITIRPSMRPLCVLLAEDNAVNQMVASKLMGKLGHKVEIASSGAEAVAAFQNAKWDLVLMDCQMPLMDGYEATRQIRNLEKALGGRTPIVALTAHAMPEDREKCLAAGMDGYLTKPLNPNDLIAVLSKLGSEAAAS